ncbi:Aerobic glycerol-3-phosphate dehydrogenase [Pseudooceanicola marinus]|uniref:Glycerol-3-phosphate dehydrogenase n=1 Tax=Pseudooceanicola marinus TaxID=396013 RepID=A0A1X7A5J5_9RHOB|nr:glycerol-3-phosphate dehydrogenase [Pseudooceanicola marinus]PJE27233.1 glycerol-3-phosphate dehydrogenase [Pseudooceanicola marinus]SLN71151.1 Aerobic glycerol-3-phosphate dehydrogenase [Pseudooceanicola marinus]
MSAPETATPATAPPTDRFDLFVIGGGVNGCGIARDAAGRGLRVGLAEMGDLAGATSSASTKLFHGGLRYLEYFEFRLVRESLIEREQLLKAMPHISWPMRFVLPIHPEMRFENSTPTSRLLKLVMPWMKGRRPAWLIRLGLFLYDNLGGREILPGTKSLSLDGTREGAPLKDSLHRAFEYSDAWVQDARLTVLNARDAARWGAQILPRTKVTGARPDGDGWQVDLQDAETGETRQISAKALVNAAGPWVADMLNGTLGRNSEAGIRLVRGSHIVTRRLYDHDKCYFFQGSDGRIIFAIPYEQDYTLIGTTDMDHPDPDQPPEITETEIDYLCAFASEYFREPVTRAQVVWTYSGVRPLYDDGASSASAATRDYTLRMEGSGPPLLSVFGGKITTYRRLAEHAMDHLAEHFPTIRAPWTAGRPLPGGDFPVEEAEHRIAELLKAYPFLGPSGAQRLFRHYGTEAAEILGDASSAADLGRDFGAGLSEAEVRHLMTREYARTAEDVVWRRTKLGLRLNEDQIAALDAWMAEERSRQNNLT